MQKKHIKFRNIILGLFSVLFVCVVAFSIKTLWKKPAKSSTTLNTVSQTQNSNSTSTSKQVKSNTVSAADHSEAAITSSEQNGAEETSLKEAIGIAYKDAKKWSKNAQLVRAGSTDAMDNPTQKSGDNGKRRNWNMTFTDVKSTHEYVVFVSQGKIDSHEQTEAGQNDPIPDKDVTLDSKDALKIAIDKKKLKPGNPDVDWAIGYHFILEYDSFYGHKNKQYLIISVYGVSPKGNFAQVDIDAKTGEIVYAGEKTYDAEGNGIWNDF